MPKKESIDLERFLPQIEEYLQAVKNESNNGVRHKSLHGSKEIFNYLLENFPEFDLPTLTQLFKAFGIKTKELFVFFSNEQTGLFVMQEPWNKPLSSYKYATATFAWYIDKKSGNKVFAISGIENNRIVAARYEASSNDEAYKLMSFDFGVDTKHSQPCLVTDALDNPSAVITKQMVKMTRNAKKMHLPYGIYDHYIRGAFFPSIPVRLPIRKN